MRPSARCRTSFPGSSSPWPAPVDAHHRQARFTWGLGPQGAEPLVIGFDVAVTAGNGQIVSVLGSLDKVPA